MEDWESVVTYERRERVACVTLNRPDAGNAVNELLHRGLTAALMRADADPEVWVVLLGGNGPHFCRGLDWADPAAEALRPPRRARRAFMGEYYEYAESMRTWWMWLWEYTKPIVARLQGEVSGWGADLALVAGTVIAAESARIGDPSIRMGLVTQNPLWNWRLGPRRARECLMLGTMLDAPTAQRLGLVTKVVPASALEEDAFTAAQTIAHQGGIVGWDGRWLSKRGFGQATHEARGLNAAWISSGAYSALAAIQRRGLQPGEFDFEARREAAGAAAAMAEMDAYYDAPPTAAQGG
ncbi:MAG: enoyl-CoA hydratase/isomerase family protein [Dehalococcoidia bacterium]|nr:enoyl-CoA hydratase/isomerase family protein [Dehalococcoidia bacterium]